MKITQDNVKDIDLDELFNHVIGGGKIELGGVVETLANDVAIPLIERLIAGRKSLRREVAMQQEILKSLAHRIGQLEAKVGQ